MTYKEIKDLVLDYGHSCIDYGDYKSKENAEIVRMAREKLLTAIKKVCE